MGAGAPTAHEHTEEARCEHARALHLVDLPLVNDECARVHATLFLNTLQPSRDPGAGWHHRRRRNGTANQYYDL